MEVRPDLEQGTPASEPRSRMVVPIYLGSVYYLLGADPLFFVLIFVFLFFSLNKLIFIDFKNCNFHDT